MKEGRGPRVPRSKGPRVPESQGPRYLKVKLKYELDSKEGPSCSKLFYSFIRFVEEEVEKMVQCL